ncbi:hypothetical protein ASPZODRAFT_13573 [Penicilliopsis zonata CBS 506.65]|uniref:Protein FAF1 n=1 Tax=Penicilliopsis zonata CBS 506.65 TaxID=1073090 RepID=A0A1L9SNM8_9EURO|nr:hypothetical protein ASPZODRAFT_13573 [Penicilliopsis zonata CBS 506.65]OJJ48835.1 hypothetical protein ASPZODRAFT_13573 [Penicilliopsis zonata CBS 506.65]
MIGKRKRDKSVVSRSTIEDSSDSPSASTDAAHDVFRRYFEAKFQPLKPQSVQKAEPGEGMDDHLDESVTGSDWDGLSEGEEDEGEDEEDQGVEVEVVDHTASYNTKDDLLDKKARKAFMSAKVPSSVTASRSKATSTKDTEKETKKEEGEDALDVQNLKNDLALQRLLRESHLLDSASDLAPTGKNRHKAIDLRLQALGAKTSIFKQEKMPSAHRLGINAKAAMKEDKRRREAKENGIILEKPTFKSNASDAKRRERGVGGPSIGKFAGGALNLSKRDLARVQGPSRRGRGKGKSRGRR